MSLDILPLAPERWPDVETLFGPRGACAGCWCMFWRLPRPEYDAGKGAGNRAAFAGLVERGDATGLLAYADGAPIAWCAVGPRTSYPRLARSRLFQPVDAQPVWSITCLFVTRAHRGRGVSVALLRAARTYAGEHGATLVEGYPVDPGKRMADPFVYTGLASAFRAAGYREVARRSPTRPIFRAGTHSAQESITPRPAPSARTGRGRGTR